MLSIVGGATTAAFLYKADQTENAKLREITNQATFAISRLTDTDEQRGDRTFDEFFAEGDKFLTEQEQRAGNVNNTAARASRQQDVISYLDSLTRIARAHISLNRSVSQAVSAKQQRDSHSASLPDQFEDNYGKSRWFSEQSSLSSAVREADAQFVLATRKYVVQLRSLNADLPRLRTGLSGYNLLTSNDLSKVIKKVAVE